jgi:hypothetical protein
LTISVQRQSWFGTFNYFVQCHSTSHGCPTSKYHPNHDFDFYNFNHLAVFHFLVFPLRIRVPFILS